MQEVTPRCQEMKRRLYRGNPSDALKTPEVRRHAPVSAEAILAKPSICVYFTGILYPGQFIITMVRVIELMANHKISAITK
jgi:hypothetical protein